MASTPAGSNELAEDHSKRTFHTSEAAHILPNDTPEHARLNAQHDFLTIILLRGTLLHSPIDPSSLPSPSTILDVGCGTGIVSRHLAATFPFATIRGVDLCEPPPTPSAPTPENLKWIVGDFMTLACASPPVPPLLPDSVQYIFSRLLVLGISNWPRYISLAAKLIAPGGWLECHDIDWVWYSSETGEEVSHEWEWLTEFRKACEERGLDLRCASRAEERFKEADLVNVRRWEFRWDWDSECKGSGIVGEGGEREKDGGNRKRKKEIWEYTKREVPDGVIVPAVRRALQGRLSDERIEELLMQMRKDLLTGPPKHWWFSVTIGQKAE